MLYWLFLRGYQHSIVLVNIRLFLNANESIKCRSCRSDEMRFILVVMINSGRDVIDFNYLITALMGESLNKDDQRCVW